MKPGSPIELLLPLGIAAAALAAMAALGSWSSAAQAWTAAYLFWMGMPVGALFATLVHGLAGGGWGLTLRPALAAMLRATPLLPLLLIPILLGVQLVYPWARTDGEGWLATPFFIGRTVFYVVLWNAIALGVERCRRANGGLPRAFAWPALILLLVTTTLAAFDWIMTLEPHWVSTIFGLMVTTGWVLGAFSLAIAATCALGEPGAEQLDPAARILLALVVLWAYLSAVQLIVIWEADLSGEIPWYLRRSADGWLEVGLMFVFAQFGLPFAILLWRPLRRSPITVSIAALAVVAGRLGEIWWLTVPDFGRAFSWVDPLAVVAIGACLLLVGRWRPGVALPVGPTG
jgi:hypothetical protein